MRVIFLVVVVGGLLSAQTACAGLVTDNIVFQNQSEGHAGETGTVSGSFTYDDSGSSPYTVTSITLGDTYVGYNVTEASPALTFNGTMLSGAVSASQVVGYNPYEGNYYATMTGTFGLSNSVTFTFGLASINFVVDTVNGPVTITPMAGAVPEPATIVSARPPP